MSIDAIGFVGENHRCVVVEPGPAVQALADSIKEDGLLSPILLTRAGGTGRDGTPRPYGVVYGHRRLAACQLIGWSTIPALVKGSMSLAEVLAERAVENLQRQDLNPVEQITAVKQLFDAATGDAQARIEHVAAKIAKTTRWVRDLLYLDERLGPEAIKLGLDGILELGHLRELAKLGDPRKQAEIARWAAGYLTKPQEGEMRRESVKAVRQRVEAEQRQLQRVQWELDQPFAKRPACQGCPHNTASDGELFAGVSDAAEGVCMNAGCYQAKQQACSTALEKVMAQAKTAGDAGKATVERIKPAFLRLPTAQRAAKKAVEGGSGKAEGGTRKAPGSGGGYGARKLTAHEKALERFQGALRKWKDAASEKVIEQLRTDATLWACWCVAGDAEPYHAALSAWRSEKAHGWEVPQVQQWSAASTTDAPKPPKPLPDKTVELLKLVVAGTTTALEKIWAMPLSQQYGRVNTHQMHDLVLGGLCTLLSINLPMPTWDDFKPAPDAPKPSGGKTKKPAKAKKASKSAPKPKLAKKKVAKKAEGGKRKAGRVTAEAAEAAEEAGK